VRIAIVNDVPMAVEALRRTVVSRAEHRVVWVAHDGAMAVKLCETETPDLVLMDLIMPGMDGVEATRRIMAATPCAILVVTSSVGANASRVFDAMGHGALDAVDTPVLGVAGGGSEPSPLLAKIDTIQKLIGKRAPAPVAANVKRAAGRAAAVRGERLLAVGSSAGGPAALLTLLTGLPADFCAAVVLIQHVDQQFAPGMADWLASHSPLPVRLAEEGDVPSAATVLLAGTGDHLKLGANGHLFYTPEPRDYAYRPSVDVFFHSAAELWKGDLVGVLLTGMGHDGATGLKALRDKGHLTIAQDRTTSAVYGMPKAAAAIDAASEILPMARIAPRILNAFSK
jgi:two-component system, chemotaxis family, response regulator WspF